MEKITFNEIKILIFKTPEMAYYFFQTNKPLFILFLKFFENEIKIEIQIKVLKEIPKCLTRKHFQHILSFITTRFVS